MSKFIKYSALILALITVFTVGMAGCSNNDTTTSTTSTTMTASTTTSTGSNGGIITEAGSTTVQPVAEAIANAFMDANPDITVVIQGGGSSTGVKSASEGTVDIGAASRELKDSEKGLGLVEYVLARDGIAIVAHPDQPVSELTTEQVMKVFSGEITNWSELGGNDAAIDVVAREEGSGTRAAFEEMVMGEALITTDAILQPSNGAVKMTVAGDENALGFLSFGYIDNTVKAMTINGIVATVDNARSGVYPIVRPLLLLTKGEPTGIVKDFIDYCLGPEGQAIAEEEGYITVGLP